jgi:hypothetical protein
VWRTDECEAGKYKAVAGVNTACNHCEAGKYKAVAGVNTACDICEAGKHKSSSYLNIACDWCVAGTYKATSGVNVECDVCEAGSYSSSVGASLCVKCPSNSISERGSTASTECMCNAGYFREDPSSPACSVCAAGKFMASIGALTCTYCEKGKYSGVGATTCVDGLPPPDIEDELMQAAKMYPTCNCTRSWREIRQSKPNTRTGGLGELMVPDKYEVWMCLQDNMCSTPADWFCYVFNEQTLKFEAWGFNSDVKVVKIVHRELPLAS